MGSSTSKPISTSVSLLEILPEDFLIPIIMNFDVFTFPPLISTCKKIRQLSLETAWKIVVPPFLNRPPKVCLQFACQEARRLNLPPMLISSSSLNSCPDDYKIGALIANPSDLVRTRPLEKLTSIAIYPLLSPLFPSSSDIKDVMAKVHEEAISGLIKREPKILKSLMLKDMYISTRTFGSLNQLTMNELRLEKCTWLLNDMNSFEVNFHLNSITKLYIGTNESLSIQSLFMFKNLKELTINQYDLDLTRPEKMSILIRADHFTSLEYL